MADTQEQTRQVVNMTIDDLIYAQVKDVGKRMDRLEKTLESTTQELNKRMDRLEHRQDRLEEKLEITRQEINQRMDRIENRMDKLENKIDALHNEIKSSTGHISIANISTVGIALGVLYSIFSK